MKGRRKDDSPTCEKRRGFLLQVGFATLAAGAASRGRAASGVAAAESAAGATATDAAVARSLAFVHTHTGESLSLTYYSGGAYVLSALSRLNVLLRDFRTESVHPVDPSLFDVLHRLQRAAGGSEAFHIISAYRSPLTNSQLHARSSGVAEHSLHMDGRAIDVRLPGVATNRLAVLARGLQRGGVGYYRVSDFVHVDTGRVRTWGDATGA